MRAAAAYLLSLSLLGLSLAADLEPCTARADGKFYDLSKLTAQKDYEFKLPNGLNASLNVCRSLADDVWKPRVDHPEDIAGRVRRAHGDFSLGYKNTSFAVRDGMPVLVYQDGTNCPKTDYMQGSAVIRFTCDKDVSGAGMPQLVAQYPDNDETACAFFFSWRTEYACPTTESSSGGFLGFIWILFVGFLGIGLLYFLVGIWYRKYVLHLRGSAIFPRLGASSVRETFAFCKDALEDLFQRRSDPFDRYGSAWSGWRTGERAGAGYDAVPATRDEEEGFLDDESGDEEDVPPTPTPARGGSASAPAPGPSPWNDQANVPQPTHVPQSAQIAQATQSTPATQAVPSQTQAAARPAGMDSSGVIKL